MTQEPRHKRHGDTISEWIALVPGELTIDAVNLPQILSAGQYGFELEGADLVDFIRRNIIALLDAGAIPVDGGAGTDYEWVAKHNYGSTKDEIADGVVAEWLASDGDEMYPWSVWFARPRSNPMYIKM